jgi:hypothetical protein
MIERKTLIEKNTRKESVIIIIKVRIFLKFCLYVHMVMMRISIFGHSGIHQTCEHICEQLQLFSLFRFFFLFSSRV